ncbi:MAG: zinc-ribbon domain-containing protein [Clostridia bacterium]|jgi:uncharacterized membrane protein YvbJ|nr:zinc-ribbon domain-containing protein [Clostridia bacterium]
MKYCSNCGKEILDDAVICPMCGSMQEKTEQKPVKDKMNIVWFIISFVWWWVGIILYFAFRNSSPYKAKVCISGTLAALVISIIIFIIIGISRLLGIVF